MSGAQQPCPLLWSDRAAQARRRGRVFVRKNARSAFFRTNTHDIRRAPRNGEALPSFPAGSARRASQIAGLLIGAVLRTSRRSGRAHRGGAFPLLAQRGVLRRERNCYSHLIWTATRRAEPAQRASQRKEGGPDAAAGGIWPSFLSLRATEGGEESQNMMGSPHLR